MAVSCELVTVMDPNVRYDKNCEKILTTREKLFAFLEGTMDFLTDVKTIIFFFIIIIAVWAYKAKKNPDGTAMNFYKKFLSFLLNNKMLVLLGIGISMTILPLMMPNKYLLSAAIANDVSYWVAISLSTFLGVRYGFIICGGMVLVTYSIMKLKINQKP